MNLISQNHARTFWANVEMIQNWEARQLLDQPKRYRIEQSAPEGLRAIAPRRYLLRCQELGLPTLQLKMLRSHLKAASPLPFAGQQPRRFTVAGLLQPRNALDQVWLFAENTEQGEQNQ